MDKEAVFEYIKNHPSGRVKIAVADMDGVLRGKYISNEKFLSVANSHLGFCNVIFGWDMVDQAYTNNSYTGWHSGYPDAKVQIDLSSFRKIPWENNMPFFLGQFIDNAGNPLEICPRQLLKKIIGHAAKQGFTANFSQEFEWFNFLETPHSFAEKAGKNLTPLSPGMFGYSILRSSERKDFCASLFNSLKAFNIPLEGLHTETGPGVYEAAITYSDALNAADNAILFKSAVKEIAYQHGILASFMAKINENLPGCSGHIHQSLWKDTTNVFYSAEDPHHMSQLMKHYLAGQLFCLPYILPMVAPTINSYKRLVEGAWAPTTITWGVDNRTVALRALTEGSKSCRLETRVVGSDTNPFLAMAACLASGLYGIANKLPLQEPTIANGYLDQSNGLFPKSLEEANHAMKNSTIAKELFGDIFVRHFTETRDWEIMQFAKAVTNWETMRYFEII
jgi:glutamine synthetase